MGAFFFEGNAYLDLSYIINSTISNSILTKSSISQSSIDMLSSSGNYQNITNAAEPILDHDVVIKKTLDDLGIVISDITLTQTTTTSISSNLKGSFIITVANLVSNGPSATFHITKNNVTAPGQINRIVASPGTSSPTCLLNITWPSSSEPLLFKTNNLYDGSYRIKFM